MYLCTLTLFLVTSKGAGDILGINNLLTLGGIYTVYTTQNILRLFLPKY